MPRNMPVTTVRVPATSANLGPGFDCLGLALALYSTFEVAPLDSGQYPAEPEIEIRPNYPTAGDDPALSQLPTDRSNLFYHAFVSHLASLDCLPPPVKIRMSLGVPPSRGLGSSAAAVVGGILAAEAFSGHQPSAANDRGDLLAAAAALEHGQHADNVAAALFGGLVVTSRDENAGSWRGVHLPVPDSLRAVLFVPEFAMDTLAGRALLPAQYGRGDTVHNIGHAALLVAALAAGDTGAIGAAMNDRCHEPYRAQLFPQLPKLLEAARAAGALGACLSGGGSSVLALTCTGPAEDAISRALASTAARLGVKGRVQIAGIDQRGAQVTFGAGSGQSAVRSHPGLEPALVCPACGSTFPLDRPQFRCRCTEPLDVRLPEPSADISGAQWQRRFDARVGSVEEKLDCSGVWRFRELLLPIAGVAPVSRPEGQTNLYPVGRDQDAASEGFRRVGQYVGLDRLWLKHEGENPTGSFKDRGMTVAVSIARWLGASAVACASTGNTAASMAAYAAQAGLPAIVLLPEGKVASGKLGQALAYGAQIQQVPGDFDVAMSRVEEMCAAEGIYLLNSLNPFRLVGQQSLALELLQQLRWNAPDWIALPAGNLGNTSALGQGLRLARRIGLIDRLPRVAAVQATGANPFYQSYRSEFKTFQPVTASTAASAINIGNPVSYQRAVESIRATHGVVVEVSDQEIFAAKATIDGAGIGCEPASAASVAGLVRLVGDGVILPGERVVAILTGHLLKDPQGVR